MRCALLLLLALITTPASASGTLFANDLALQCSSQEREKRLICEAFVDGFLAGLSTDGNACPTPEAVICTYRCALRVWPEAPAHNNQALRYWLKPKGLNPTIANLSHRALPDAYVTAFILRELLQKATVESLIAWTRERVLLPRITFGRHRGSPWTEVPQDYLDWIVDRSDLGEDVKFTAAHYRGGHDQRGGPP